MYLSLADQYYLKAADYYPYSMEFVMENLNYAMSYDNDHAQANCLMGKVYMYQLKQYDVASYYFNRAVRSDLRYPETYAHYSLLKIWQSDINGAKKLIDYGMKVDGVSKSALMVNKALIYECMGDFKMAKSLLKKAFLLCIDQSMEFKIKIHLTRIKNKIKGSKVKRSKSKNRLVVA